MIFLLFFSGGIYFLLIASLFYGWFKLKPFQQSTIIHPIPVSVILPVRNESRNLPNIINAIKQQHYPSHLIEIIIVDDHSTDGSFEIAKHLISKPGIVSCLPIHKTGKKAALWQGLSSATGELLLLTDADCIPGSEWVITLANYYITKKPALILAPVIGHTTKNIFKTWQQLEIFSLLGSTAGSAAIGHPIMSNGANLSFGRIYLEELKPVYSSDIASGDDMFVLEYMKIKYPGSVHFIKSHKATITTSLATNFKQFLNQRRRWAAKARFYSDPDIIIAALIVLLLNLTCVIFLVYGFISNRYFYFIVLLGMKTTIDWALLTAVAVFYKEKKTLYWVPVVQGFYFFYVSFTFLGSFTGNFKWKSRKLKA
jgi:cellulose synthase/poly-beta-1,6-N-acetylglucosamine synthase-like glycosyltransferase